MIEASRLLEREAKPAWCEALARHERDAEAARLRDKEWREEVQKAVAEGIAPPERPSDAQEPERPPQPRVLAMDTSTEVLQRMLADNPRGLLYVRDELAGWLGGFDRYGGNGADRAFYLETWNGGPYVCDRVRYQDVPLRIEHASLAIIGGMVPDRLREVLADADDGLLARLIYIWPDPPPIVPLLDRGDADAGRRRDVLIATGRRLRGSEMDADFDGTPAPRALRLHEDGFALFDELRQDAMRRTREASGFVAGWYGKNPGRALRLALVYELLAWAVHGDAEPVTVSADAVARAGGYLDYAAGMLDRVTAGLAITCAEVDAVRIARHLLVVCDVPRAGKPARLNERVLYQTAGFTWARDTKRLAQALAVLEQAAWIRRPNADGRGRPRGDWEVSPRLWDGR
jgi:hypothetical protein